MSRSPIKEGSPAPSPATPHDHTAPYNAFKLVTTPHLELANSSPCSCMRSSSIVGRSTPLPPSACSSSISISPPQFTTDSLTPQHSHSLLPWNQPHEQHYSNNSNHSPPLSDSPPPLESSHFPSCSSRSVSVQRSASLSDSLTTLGQPTELTETQNSKHNRLLSVAELQLDSPADLDPDICWLHTVYSRHFLGRDHLLSCVLQQSLEANGGNWIMKHRQQLLENIQNNGFTLTVNVQGETMLHALSECTHLADKYSRELADFFYSLFQLLLKNATPQLINSRNFQTGETALYRLLSSKTPATNLQLVLLLRSHGADVNSVSLNENNPSSFLHSIIQTHDSELLLDWLAADNDLESIQVDVDFDFAAERRLLQSQREATSQHIQPLSQLNQVGTTSRMSSITETSDMVANSAARSPSVLSAAIAAAHRAPHFHRAAIIADVLVALRSHQIATQQIKSNFLQHSPSNSPFVRFPSASSTAIVEPRSPSLPSAQLDSALRNHRNEFRTQIRHFKDKFNQKLMGFELCGALDSLRSSRTILIHSNFASLTVPSASTTVDGSDASHMDDEEVESDDDTDMATEYDGDCYVESSAAVAVNLLNSRLPSRTLDFAQAAHPDSATAPRAFLLRSIAQLSPKQLEGLSHDAVHALISGVDQFCIQCEYGDLAAHKELIHIAIDELLSRHHPRQVGDLSWQLYNSLFRKYLQIEHHQRERESCTCTVQSSSASSFPTSSVGSCRKHAPITVLWSWLHKITRRDHFPSAFYNSASLSSASSFASSVPLPNETNNWSFESITIVLRLFDSLEMQYDILAQLLHDENYSVIIQLIRSYLSVDSLAIHPPSLPGNQTLFELLEERVNQTMERFAASPDTTFVHPELTLVQAELCLWREGIWPVARGVLEEHLIPDLADLVMGHLMPVPEAARKNHQKRKKRKAESDIQAEEFAKKTRSHALSF